MIALSIHPPRQHHTNTHILETQLPTGVGSIMGTARKWFYHEIVVDWILDYRTKPKAKGIKISRTGFSYYRIDRYEKNRVGFCRGDRAVLFYASCGNREQLSDKGMDMGLEILHTKIREAREMDVPELEKLLLFVRQETFLWKDPKNFTMEDYKKSTENEKVFFS